MAVLQHTTSNFWKDLTGQTNKDWNRQIDNAKVDQINQFNNTGQQITNELNKFNEDSTQYAMDFFGDEWDLNINQVDNSFSQQQADALSRATASGAGVSSTAMYNQTALESMNQDAQTDMKNMMKQQSIEQSLAPYQNDQKTAQGTFNQLGVIPKKNEAGFLETMIVGGGKKLMDYFL